MDKEKCFTMKLNLVRRIKLYTESLTESASVYIEFSHMVSFLFIQFVQKSSNQIFY